MAYERINWQNEPSEATALNDVNLNKMDSAIYELDGKATTTETAITNLQDGKVDKVTGKGLSELSKLTITPDTVNGNFVASIKMYDADGEQTSVYLRNGVTVDSALSSSSENPVQNKVVKSAIDGKSTVAISDTLATGTTLANITIDGTTTAIKGSDIEVDEELSPTSTNPVENKAIYDALNNLLPSKTVSGNPIAISDASGFNAKALTVSMNPIQDLHGYDHPWAGGAGKNKIDEATVWSASYSDGLITNPSGNDKFYIPSALVGVQLTFSAYVKANTSSASCRVRAFENGTAKDGNLVQTTDTYSLTKVTFTPTSTSDYVVLVSGGANGTYKEVQLEIGATNTSFAPYSNICPISGRTEASVTRTVGEDVETKTHQYSDTIYGGTDDFVNGKLIVDIPSTAKVKLSDLNWNYQSEQSRFYSASLASLIKRPSTFDEILDGMACECYKINSYSAYINGQISVSASGNLFLKDENYTDVTTLLNAIGDYYIAYPLATPTTIETSAENITLLKGNNVLSTNADDMELKYSVSLDSLLS